MILGTQMSFVYADDTVAELGAEFTQNVLSAKGGNLALERKNYSQRTGDWDSEAEVYFERYISTTTNSSDNQDSGTGSNAFYIGHWSIGVIPVKDIEGGIYIGVYAKTNSASKPSYSPMKLKDASGATVNGNFEGFAEKAFAGSGEWEFNKIPISFSDAVATFEHGQLRLGTAKDCYFDLAAWGIFASSVSDDDAKAALISASKATDSEVNTVTILDRNENVASVVNLLKNKSTTLPSFENTATSAFKGWTSTKGSYAVIAEGGASYTPTADVTLYPVWVDYVRFVDETASANGNGYTPDSPYNKFASAATDLALTGGTIVIMGTMDITDEVTAEVEDVTALSSPSNTGDLVITSVYGGVDYRTYGAKLKIAGTQFGYVENPGKITFTGLDIISTSWNNWNFNGHDAEITESCTVKTADGGNLSNIQILMFQGGEGLNKTYDYKKHKTFTIGNENNISVILGTRSETTMGSADVIINGKLSNVIVSNNTYEKTDWLDTSPRFGQLTVDGDVRITVNGSLTSKIYAKLHYLTADTYDYGLKKIVGSLGVIIADGATYRATIDDIVKERTEGIWFTLAAAKNTTLSYGEGARNVVLTLGDGLDYNFANLKNSDTNKTYAFFIDDGEAEIYIPESGSYTITLSKNESKTVTLVDKVAGTSPEPLTTISVLTVTLPALSNTETHKFMGWTDVEDGTEAKYAGESSYKVTDDITLYAVWTEAETYTVTFMADGKEFDSFTGIEGKAVVYPTAYPEKNGYYFKKWDKTIETIGTEDITVNAVFVSVDEVGYIYYLTDDAEDGGNGSYNAPFNSLKAACEALNKTGGTVVLTGKTYTEYQPKLIGTKDVVFTALDPVTGVDYSGGFVDGEYVGAHFLLINKSTGNGTGTFWGGANYQTGKITVRDIDFVNNGTAQHWTFDGHPFEIGENVAVYNGTNGKESYFFFGGTSGDNGAIPHAVKGVFRSPTSSARNWLARAGTTAITVDSADYDFYEKGVLNLCNDNATTGVTINGPIRVTLYENASDTRLFFGRTNTIFGTKTYASVILNDGTTVKNEMETTEGVTGLIGKVYTIKSPVGGTVTHTETRGKYNVESDTYNYAELVNKDGETVDEAIIVGGGLLSAPDYGEYSVVYSTKSVYSAQYVTSPYDELCPDSYAVTSDMTDKHTITLPTLKNQEAHRFMGWATAEDADTAEYAGGASYTLGGAVTFYAVWEALPTATVTFKNDNGEVIHTVTNFVGAPITFPENNPFRYGEKLLGYAYEGTTDILSADAVLPESNKTALPVWGAVPAGEVRLYVNSVSGNDSNSGLSPDAPLATIAKAVSTIAKDGGYIILTGGTITLTGGWNNKGDITLTSYDALSDISYKATTLASDKLSFVDGAVVLYSPTMFGMTVMDGKITIENIAMLNRASYQFLNFNGHPYEIGEGISVYLQANEESAISRGVLYIRSLGESNSINTLDDGITFTVNTVDASNVVLNILGKANNTIPGVNLTVNTKYTGDLKFGNDSGGGKATVVGDSRFTFNAGLTKAMTFQSAYTNPIEGNVYALFNNGSAANLSALVFAQGYGLYTVRSGDKATLAHGKEAGTFELTLGDGYSYRFAKLLNTDGVIVDYVEIKDGKALLTLPASGDYSVDYTDVSCHRISFVTGDENIVIGNMWCEDNTDVEIPNDLYRYSYIFGGWTDGTKTYTDGIIAMPEENITLTAIWTEAPEYTVSFDANGSDIEAPASVTDYENEKLVLENKKSDTVTFLGWSENPDATIGVLNHVITKDTTLYAITTAEPVYIIDSHYRGDPEDYTGDRCQFRRYVIDVYLENAVASSGVFKLNTDNGFLYYLGHVPVAGIEATVTRTGSSGTVSGYPGLQYSTTKTIEFSWTSEAPIDTLGGRRRIARIMMYYSSWGMGYDEVEKRTTDEVVSPFAGFTAKADDKTALVSANFYKGIKDEEVSVVGKVTLEGRESGCGAAYDLAKLYILDSAGDAVDYIVLENEETTSRTFIYEASLLPGEYTVRVIKGGYITREAPVTVTEACELPEIVISAGDTTDASGKGDGVVDVDDFVRVLKGFSKDFPVDSYLYALDVNEDGIVNVSDLAVIKGAMTRRASVTEIVTEIDRSMKLGDWSLALSESTITVVGGSEKAIEGARAYIENECMNGNEYAGPGNMTHTQDYEIYDISVADKCLGDYRIVIPENDETALEYAQYIRDYIAEVSGFGLDIVYDTEAEAVCEIIVGDTARRENPIDDIHKYLTYEENGKLYVFYGDEQAAEMACLDLCEKILGKESGGFDGLNVEVTIGARCEGEWSVLTRFGVMADTHVGEGKNWANYDWLQSTFDNFEKIHAENPLDFLVGLGDLIDDGYASTYATDYATYLEQVKGLDICDPVNPVEGRAEGKIPHYELCGNHDPVGVGIGGAGSIRFMKNGLWYTENENGEKVAHIAFFTDYGGYPLYNKDYSGSTNSYRSYGKANDEMVKFVEESIIAAKEEGAIHVILYNHYGIAQDLGAPVLPETGLEKIAQVCEKYGIKLFFNGHEHDNPYTLRRYKDIYDYDASMTCSRHSVVEITTLRAKVTIYNKDGSVYREDIVPLSGRGEAKQTMAK